MFNRALIGLLCAVAHRHAGQRRAHWIAATATAHCRQPSTDGAWPCPAGLPKRRRHHRDRTLAHAENHLIELLARDDRRHLLVQCEQLELATLVMADVLCEPGQRLHHVFFPIGGVVTLVTRLDYHAGLEVGMVGHEGMLGAQVALGVLQSPLRAVVQGPGTAWRIGAEAFAAELVRSEALRHVVHGYLAARMAQLAVSAACLRFHLIGPRLARWLLLRHDRAQVDRFGVTQEFLAQLLGVRRVGITTAACSLQRQGLIEYHRGQLRVFDRAGLEAVACSCYAADRQA